MTETPNEIGDGEQRGLRRLFSKLAATDEAQKTMQAVWNGAVIAQSNDTVVVEGNHYFPIDDVNADFLEPSSHHTLCPWKGLASYHDVVVDGQVNRNAAWYYAKPSPVARRIKGRVAFWHGVHVHTAD